MRSLIILKGLVKSDKQNWVKREGLMNFFLDIDYIKKLFYRPDYKGSKEFLTRSFDDVVYKVFLQALCSRLSTGTLVVIDIDNDSVSSIEDLAFIFGYTVFYHVESTPYDYVGKNKKYCNFQYIVPTKDTLKREVLDFSNIDYTGKNLINNYADIEDYWKPLTRTTIIDKNDTVLHISDLHSHWNLLNTKVPKFSKYPLVVFAGDYIDGPEKGGSRKLIEQILGYKGTNAIFLEGNHELRLRKYLGYTYIKGKGKKIVSEVLLNELSEEFLQKTADEFSDLKMLDSYEMLLGMNNIFRESFIYERGKNTYICTHAGLRWIDQISPKFIGNVIYSNKNTERVDLAFSERYNQDNIWSIHGHCKYNVMEFCRFPGVINFDTEDETKVNYFINYPNKKIKVCVVKD